MSGLGPRIGRGLKIRRKAQWHAIAVLLVGAGLAGCAGPATTVQPHLPDFQKLAGMSAADLERALGEPDFRRSEPPAEVWQYRGDSCVLDLFLYRDGAQYRVVYAETRDRDTIRVAEANCYSSLFTHPGHEARNQG